MPVQTRPWPADDPRAGTGPRVEALVTDLIGRVADKWTMLAIEALSEHKRSRFMRLGELIGGVSQKMLTKTLRQMESDGLVSRKSFLWCRRALSTSSRRWA